MNKGERALIFHLMGKVKCEKLLKFMFLIQKSSYSEQIFQHLMRKDISGQEFLLYLKKDYKISLHELKEDRDIIREFIKFENAIKARCADLGGSKILLQT